MGSASSKFRKHLQNGDEYAALQLYQNSSDLRKGLDPNLSYGDSHGHDTPLHYAGRHAMKTLLKIFLFSLNGNPNKTNSADETVLHLICRAKNGHAVPVRQRRAECVSLVLQWRGATLQDGEVEKVNLGSQDQKHNIPLHYAADSGLRKCVELLVNQGSPLFVENDNKETPCDSAEKAQHSDIALYLESKMVFSNSGGDCSEDVELLVIENMEAYSGLRAQDLQEAKDQLLVETSDMLRVPLFTAEALLRNHEWSRETLLEAWMADAKACCEKCGVVPPSNIVNPTGLPDLELKSPICRSSSTSGSSIVCNICAHHIPDEEDLVTILCEHQFCKNCWEGYLNVKIQEGDIQNITCPAFGCSKLVPVEVLDNLVSRDMARRYLQFDIKAFVEGNPNIKWCPFPGCGRAVKLPEDEDAGALSPRARKEHVEDTSRAVDCGNGHLFCWDCLGDSHEPCSCECWVTWQTRIAEVRIEQLGSVEKQSESAANCLWLVTNSKPCPNCKSPIQKNEGCNHMKCSKCKHDFCWICLEQWKKHSSATGGYFRCNRYEVSKKVESEMESQVAEAQQKNAELQERKKFVHYYTRFKNHENSYKLEVPLLSTAKNKMMELARAVHSCEQSVSSEVVFVEEAIQQLLKARQVLKCSYVYGFYLEDEGIKKQVFESMQTELEECTENLSEMIARPYLRTPRSRIIQTAQLVSRKRREFVTSIAKGLVPAEFSPRGRKRFTYEITEDLRKSILESMSDHDTARQPWARDPRTGRHANLEAILDWPVESDDSDSESHKSGSPQEDSVLDLCHRRGCDKPRARNPRTGELHEHCSLRCLRTDRVEMAEREENMLPSDFVTDYQVDLLRALEMSRLQLIRDMTSISGGGDGHSTSAPWKPSPIDTSSAHFPNLMFDDENLDSLEEFDPDFQRALEMSRLSYQTEAEPAEQLLTADDDNGIEEQPSSLCASANIGATDSTACRVLKASDVASGHSQDLGVSMTETNSDHMLDHLGTVCDELGKMLEGEVDASKCEDDQEFLLGNEVSLLGCSTFGLIKDVSVTNLVSSEHDKTQSFKNKDFKMLCKENSQNLEFTDDTCEGAGVSCDLELPDLKDDFVEPSNIQLKLEDVEEFGTSTTEDDFDHLLASIHNPSALSFLPKVRNDDIQSRPWNACDATGTQLSFVKSNVACTNGTTAEATDAQLLLNNADVPYELSNDSHLKSISSDHESLVSHQLPQMSDLDLHSSDLDLDSPELELQSVIRALESITAGCEASDQGDVCSGEESSMDKLSLKDYEGHEFTNM